MLLRRLMAFGLSASGFLAMNLAAQSFADDLRRIDAASDRFAAAVVVEREPLVQTAQLLPLDPDGDVTASGAVKQADVVLQHLKAVLSKAGSGIDRVARLHVCLAREADADDVRRSLLSAIPEDARPAATFVVTPLPHPRALIAIDAIAACRPPAEDKPVLIRAASVPGAKERAHAVAFPVGRVIFLSGQAEQGTLAEATKKTMQSLHDTLKFLEVDPSSVVQIKTFVKPMAEIAVADREIDAFSPGRLVPAVTHVEWTLGSPIEIEMIAWAPLKSPVPDDPVTYLAPPHLKHSPIFSRIAVVETGRLVFVSGISGDENQTGEQQVRTIFDRLAGTLKQSGSDFRHMAKATYYVSDDDPSAALNKVRPELYDPARPPAASKAGVKSVAAPGRGLVIDMIAAPK